jgi:cell envelope opacity-associated protein A
VTVSGFFTRLYTCQNSKVSALAEAPADGESETNSSTAAAGRESETPNVKQLKSKNQNYKLQTENFKLKTSNWKLQTITTVLLRFLHCTGVVLFESGLVRTDTAVL